MSQNSWTVVIYFVELLNELIFSFKVTVRFIWSTVAMTAGVNIRSSVRE